MPNLMLSRLSKAKLITSKAGLNQLMKNMIEFILSIIFESFLASKGLISKLFVICNLL